MKPEIDPKQLIKLQRVLDTLIGFELIILGYRSPAVFKEMLRYVGEILHQKRIASIEVDLSGLSNPAMFETLLKQKSEGIQSYSVFQFTGIEQHVKKGEVSSFLNQLNLLRDRLSKDYPYGFFFWFPEYSIERFTLDAPDLWAWRNTVIILNQIESDISKFIDETEFSQFAEETEYKNFSFKEKQRQIEYLKETEESFQGKNLTLKEEAKLASVYTELGELYSLIADYKTGLDYFQKGLDIINRLEIPEDKESINKNIENITKRIKRGMIEASQYTSGREIKNQLKTEEKKKIIPSHTSHLSQTKSLLLTPLPRQKFELLGRERELKELEEKIKNSNHLLLVNGMGGIGKTEVCKRFFNDHYCDFPYAAWVNYTGSFKESLTNAMDKELTGVQESPNVDDQFNQIMEYINDLNGELLLVVDNISRAPSEDTELELLFRFPQHVRIIATSRLSIDEFEVYPLDLLSESSCIQLFYTFYKGKPDDESIKEIIRLCGFHTLTVELLARTAQNSMKPVKVLLDILREKGFNLSDAIPETTGTFYKDETRQKKFFDHLLTVFELTNVTENEEHLLSNISVLPPLYISVEDIKDWLHLESIEDITTSIKKGWLKEDDNFNIYMHPVIGEVIRKRTKPDSSKCATLIQSLTRKLSAKPGDNPMDNVPFVIFGESLLRYIHDETVGVATLANNLSATYLTLGQLEQALEYQSKALKIREKVLIAEHPDLAQSYNNLSMIYQDMGQLELALEFQLKALTIREKVLGAEHPLLATSYNNISTIYQDMGQLELALEFGLKDLAISEKVLGAQHPDLAGSYNNLSGIYQDMGQFKQALEFQLKANAIYEKVLGAQHPNLAQSYNNLAMIYQDMGQLEQALRYQLKALTILEKVFGVEHPALAISYNNLSMIYKDLGQLDKALPYIQKAIAIMEKLFPKGHPNLDKMRINLASIQAEMRKNVLTAD